MSAPSLPELVTGHWALDLMVIVPISLYAALYLGAAITARSRWPAERTLSFLAGLGCVFVALQSGIGRYDDRLLSVHMVQHMLLLFLAPLLLLAGRPAALALRVLHGRSRQA